MAGRLYQWFDGVTGLFKISAGAQLSTGVSDAGKIVALNSVGLVDDTMLSSSPIDSAITGEAISAGDAVNVYDDTGTKKIRKADNTNNRKCDGISRESAASGVSCKYDTDGARSSVTGVATGLSYWLGAAGAITTTPTTTITHLLQHVGTGAGTGVISVEIATPATFE